MCKRLNFAKMYKVELEYGDLCGDEIDAFMRLLDFFDIKIAYRSADDRDLEIRRAELERLRNILAFSSRIYARKAEQINAILSDADMTRVRMIAALDIMITRSDPNDGFVHIFCD